MSERNLMFLEYHTKLLFPAVTGSGVYTSNPSTCKSLFSIKRMYILLKGLAVYLHAAGGGGGGKENKSNNNRKKANHSVILY